MNACIFHDTDASLHDRRVFEIVDEAYNRGETVVVFTGTEERAAEIDRFLWILRQESFIPHKIALAQDEKITVPVVIVTSEWNPAGAGILIVDRHCRLEYAAGFDMIHEFVDRSSPETQEACRKRFRAYRDKKISVEYLKTGLWKGADG
jgi:DNA polymerase IIIc chi subunit